jgi:uncharacterized protein YegP (UPF0339 family)
VFNHWQLIRFPEAKQRWRWRLLAANNRTLLEGGHPYDSINAARKAVKRIRTTFCMAGVIVFDSKGKVVLNEA